MDACERRILEVRLTAARALLRAAVELVKTAALLTDGRLPSFEALEEALRALHRAAARLEDELATLTGLDKWVRRIIREVLVEAQG